MPQILQFEEPWDKLLIDNDVDKSSFSQTKNYSFYVLEVLLDG